MERFVSREPPFTTGGNGSRAPLPMIYAAAVGQTAELTMMGTVNRHLGSRSPSVRQHAATGFGASTMPGHSLFPVGY
jgi:hypothetical protein